MAELIGGLWPEGPEGQDLRVWTPDATALFKGLASQGPAAGETFSAVVEGRRALPCTATGPKPNTGGVTTPTRRTLPCGVCSATLARMLLQSGCWV